MLKKVAALCLLITLLTGTAAFAGTMGLSDEEIYELTTRLFKQHGEAHPEIATSESMPGNGGMVFRCKYPVEKPEGLLACMDFGFTMNRIMPSDAAAMNVLFRELLQSAIKVAKTDANGHVMDLARVEELRSLGSLISYFPEPALWLTGEFLSAEMIITPFYLKNIQDNVIDGRMYFMLLMSSEKSSQIWICADQEVVKTFYAALDLSQGKASFVEPIQQWMTGSLPSAAGSTQTAKKETSAAPDKARIGSITITSQGTVNIRSAAQLSSPIVGKAAPGDVFDCFGKVGSEWYEIQTGSGKQGFIPVEMASYTIN